MKLRGSITELVSLVMRKVFQVTIRPNSGTTYTADRVVDLPPQDANSVMVSEDAAQTLTNKSLDGGSNTFTNVVAASFTGSLLGDVTGTQSSTAVATVGTSTAANVHLAELAANAAASSNTVSTIVKRDGSGNFSAGTITAALSGNATTATTATTSTNFSGALTGDVTGTQASTAVATVGTSSATNIHNAELAANAATNLNTASTLVKRDASGNFAAGVITADLTGNASGTANNVTGTVAIANGGTGQTAKTAAYDALSPTTTKGDLEVHDGTDVVRVAVGTDGQVLSADSAQTSGVSWVTAASSVLNNGDVEIGNNSNVRTPVDTSLLGYITANSLALTATFSATNPAVVTTASSGLAAGDKIYFETTGTLPAGLSPDLTYYASPVTTTTFNIAGNRAQAISGSFLALGDTGSGTHTAFLGGLNISAQGVPAVPDDSAIAEGYVGFSKSQSTFRSSAVSLTSNAISSVTASPLVLIPGNWTVYSAVGFQPNATASITSLTCALSLSNSALPSTDTYAAFNSDGETTGQVAYSAQLPGAGGDTTITMLPVQVSVPAGATKTLYLIAVSGFTGAAAAVGVYGQMWARRS